MLSFVTRHLYPLAWLGGMAIFAIAMMAGWPLEAVVIGWSVLVLITGALLERVAPFEARWRRADGDLRTDASSAVVLIGLVDPLVKAVLAVAAVALLAKVDASSTPWLLHELPCALQVVAAVLWIEFAKYWAHRVHHTVPSLWWLHALHHSSERLYWLNNFRFHPLNHFFNTAASLFPLLVLGAPAEVLLGALAVTQPVVMLQHANVRSASGWLNYLLSTNEVHRWHHSAIPGEANSNFGSALVVWDHVFRTFRYRAEGNRPTRVGLFGEGGGYPARAPYLQQLLSLFTPACCRA